MTHKTHIAITWLLAWNPTVACSSRHPIELDRSSFSAVSSESAETVHDRGPLDLPSDNPRGEPSQSDVGGATSSPLDPTSLGVTPSPVVINPPVETTFPAATTAPSQPVTPPPVVETPPAPTAATVTRAIVVSVDGLAPRYLETLIETGRAPTFQHLQSVAAWTHNARTDKTYTITLPNHTSMLTGLPVSSALGVESFRAHFYTWNSDPAPSDVLHTLRMPARDYTPSVFDVAHDYGLSTAMFASKTKFSLYAQSYNEAGRADAVGIDNGRKKIDTVVINTDPTGLVAQLVSMLAVNPAHFTFVHLNQPDGVGHALGWGSPEYLTAVSQMDALLGEIVSVVDSGPFAQQMALIVTTDHGGTGTGHFDSNDASNFQIPFYLMAPGVSPGDAYAAFGNRFPPEGGNPDYRDPLQPLRNGDSGNLALDLLGLPPVPESLIHSARIITQR